MEPLSSFAISLAAGIALDYYKFTQSTVKNELKSAFRKALKLWCKNESIRERKKNELSRKLLDLFKTPERLADVQTEDSDLDGFLRKYEEAISEYNSAHNYLKEIKDLERFKREVELLESIRDSLDELNEKIDFLNEKLLNVNIGLDKEWTRQIEVYKSSIQNFKPNTALELILELENSFNLNEYKPSNAIIAAIEYLKGQCYELIGNVIEMNSSYLRAYRIDNSNLSYKEKASFALAKSEEKKEAISIANEIISIDEFNYVAWAVIVLACEKELEVCIDNVPDLVKDNIDFKRIVFFNTRGNFEYQYLDKLYKTYSILPDINSFDQSPISFKNYKVRLFLIETIFTKIYQSLYFDFNTPFTGNIELVKILKPFLEDLLEHLNNSEISKNYKNLQFYNQYFCYVLNNDKGAVDRMKTLYDESETREGLFTLILANCLQQIDKLDEAIDVINTIQTKSVESVYLEAFCYLKNNDIDGYAEKALEVLKLIPVVNLISIENILNIANTLNEYGKISLLDRSISFENVSFEFDYLKIFTQEYYAVLRKKTTAETIRNLKSIEENLLSIQSKVIFHVAYCYYLLNEFEEAIRLFDNYLDKENESRDLFFYIKSLDKSSVHNEELLSLLKFWRQHLSFNDEFLRMEADLRRQLSDWDSCAEICKYYLEHRKQDESFLTLYLISINESDKRNKEELLKQLANTFSSFQIKLYVHAQIVSSILLQNNFHKIALEILYSHAINKDNKQARMGYFTAILHLPQGFISEYQVVDKGMFVKYVFDKEIKFIEIKGNSILEEALLGHSVGEDVMVQRPMLKIFDSIRILRIMDKYLCLHDEILEEVKNPHSGMPMQSFEFKDNSPEGMIETFVELFGAEGTVRKEQQENSFRDYYNYILSFSELILQNYNSDYIGGYFNLVNYRDGLSIVPSVYYSAIQLDRYDAIILDFTSLILFYQYSRETSIAFKHKFIISKTIHDYIKSYKKKESWNGREQLSISVSLDGVEKSLKPEEVFKSNISYLINLLDWIEKNCIVKISESKLNITRKLQSELNNEFFANYVLENISLVLEHEKSILVSDDLIHAKFFPFKSGRLISTEIYIKNYIEDKTEVLSEFIRNKYIGITITVDVIISEYDKKIKGQENLYSYCINNLSLTLNPAQENINSAISLLKAMVTSSLVNEDILKLDAINIFVILLRGQTKIKIFNIVELLIRKEFKLLGIRQDFILDCFNEALMILQISKR